MAAREIKAGEAYVIISAKLDQLREDLKKGKGEFKSWGSSLKGVSGMVSGLFAGISVQSAVAAVNAAVKHFADIGSEMNDMSGRTGIAATKLGEWMFAAKQSGATAQDLEAALRGMARKGFDVSKLEQIGLSIAAIGDSTARSARAMEVFGKSGTRLLPMFSELKSLKAAYKELGPTITEEDVKRADELGDAFGALAEAQSRAAQQIGASLHPIIKEWTDLKVGLAIITAEFAKAHKIGDQGKDKALGMGRFPALGLGPIGPLQALIVKGREATEAAARASEAKAKFSEDEAETQKEQADALKQQEAVLKGIIGAYEKRNALIREFETPHERFLRREQEIKRAIQDTQQARNSQQFNVGAANQQIVGLMGALQRLRTEESERLASALEKLNTVTMPEVAKAVAGSARGTFSAAGAGMLGRGGDAIEREQKVQTRVLRNIETNTRNNGAVARFS